MRGARLDTVKRNGAAVNPGPASARDRPACCLLQPEALRGPVQDETRIVPSEGERLTQGVLEIGPLPARWKVQWRHRVVEVDARVHRRITQAERGDHGSSSSNATGCPRRAS